MTNSVEKYQGSEIIPLANGARIALFENAQMTDSGLIVVPKRRIALAGFATAATLDVRLRPAKPLDVTDTDWADILTATGQPPDERDIFFLHDASAYAVRNIYPLGDLVTHEDTGVSERSLAKLAINVSWDNDLDVVEAIKSMGNSAVEMFEGEKKERVRALLKQPFQAAFPDISAGRQPILLNFGQTIAIGVPSEEGWDLQQGYASVAEYVHFGIVGGAQYYDKLTEGARDLNNISGASILVPNELKALRDTTLSFVLPEQIGELAPQQDS